MESVNTKYLLALLIIFITAAATIYFYNDLPEKIPTHFDAKGRPNGWSDKGPEIFAMIGVQLFLLATMAFSYYFLADPERFAKLNQSKWSSMKFPPDMVEPARIVSIRLIDWIMFLSLIMLGEIQIEILWSASSGVHRLSPIVWVFLALITIVSVYYTVVLVRMSLKAKA